MCLIYFLWLTLHIRILPESSARTQAAWQLPVSSLLTPIFLSSSRGQGPHAQQTPEPWCLQVIETTRLALQGKHWVLCICTYGTIVPAVWRRLTSYSINAHAIDQQEVFVRYLTHQAGSLKEWLQDVKKREMSTLLDLTGVVVCSWPKKCSIIFCMLFALDAPPTGFCGQSQALSGKPLSHVSLHHGHLICSLYKSEWRILAQDSPPCRKKNKHTRALLHPSYNTVLRYCGNPLWNDCLW